MLQEIEFLLCENHDSMPGPGLVLSTCPPYWIGKVVQFKTEDDLFKYLSAGERKLYKCKGYKIGIIIIGSMERTTPHIEDDETYSYTYNSMAKFLLEKKILKNVNYYKRYKEEGA